MQLKSVKNQIIAFLKDEEGASGIEYALVAAMVAVALVIFVEPVRTAIESVFTEIQTELTNAGSTD